MSNLKPLKPINWRTFESVVGVSCDATTPICEYDVWQSDGRWVVEYYNRQTEEPTKIATGFATIDEAKAWAWKHYNEKMQPYVVPDSITDIANWFKAAKPEPTKKDICTQVGCHYEEVAEMMEAMQGHDHRASQMMSSIADTYKMRHLSVDGIVESVLVDSMQPKDNIELLDALCDQIVTATGVAYMMGFDIEGALKEVIRSNNSKMVKGKFEFDDNGKIMKPESYSEPDLTRFVEVTK